MKLRPVLTASALGGLIVAASTVPAFADETATDMSAIEAEVTEAAAADSDLVSVDETPTLSEEPTTSKTQVDEPEEATPEVQEPSGGPEPEAPPVEAKPEVQVQDPPAEAVEPPSPDPVEPPSVASEEIEVPPPATAEPTPEPVEEPVESRVAPLETQVEAIEGTTAPEEVSRTIPMEEDTSVEVGVEIETPVPDPVDPPDFTERTEISVELETMATDDLSEQVAESITSESVEVFAEVPAEETPVEAAAVLHALSTADTTSPPGHNAAVSTLTPSSQASAAEPATSVAPDSATQPASEQEQQAAVAAPVSPVLALSQETSNSPVLGTNTAADTLTADQGPTPVGDEGQRDIPPEPREVSIIEPSEISEQKHPEEDADKAPQRDDEQHLERKEQRIESAPTPDNGPLPETGAVSLVLAVAGVFLLTAGVVLFSKRPRVSEAAPHGRELGRD